MTDIYQPYRDMLAGKPVPIHADVPYPGRYKMKLRDGTFVAVLINHDANGEIKARIGDEITDPIPIWTYCAKHPVDKAAFDVFNATGSWPGDAPATVGDNSKHYGEGFDGLQSEINDYAEMCRQFLKDAEKTGGIKTKAKADQAGNMADAIGKGKSGLAKKADDARDAEMRPHLEAQREINAKYKALIEIGVDMAIDLRKVAEVWTKAERDRLQKIANEEARKAQEIANVKAKAAREAWEREQAAIRAKAPDAQAPLDLPPPPAAAPTIVAEKVKVQIAGQRGNQRSLKTRRIAVIEDYAKALAFFAESSDVKAIIQTLAQRAVTAKMPVPGVGVREEETL